MDEIICYEDMTLGEALPTILDDGDKIESDDLDVPFSRKSFVAKEDSVRQEGERDIVSTISTEEIDRDKEVVMSRGGNFKAFNRNPVVLWSHDMRLPPIGRAKWIKSSGDDKKLGAGKLIARTEFAETPMGEEIFQLLKGKFLRAFSIGFYPTKMHAPKPEDIKAEPMLADARLIFDKWVLLEYSVVSVPANASALAMAVGTNSIKLSKGMLTTLGVQTERVAEDMRRFITFGAFAEHVARSFDQAELTPELMSWMETAGVRDWYGSLKHCPPYVPGPKAPKDATYDLSAEQKKAELGARPMGLLAGWTDCDNVFRFVHHRANGEVVLRAVKASMAELLRLDESDMVPVEHRREVYNHLRRHYEEFDCEPPEFKSYDEDEIEVACGIRPKASEPVVVIPADQFVVVRSRPREIESDLPIIPKRKHAVRSEVVEALARTAANIDDALRYAKGKVV